MIVYMRRIEQNNQAVAQLLVYILNQDWQLQSKTHNYMNRTQKEMIIYYNNSIRMFLCL